MTLYGSAAEISCLATQDQSIEFRSYDDDIDSLIRPDRSFFYTFPCPGTLGLVQSRGRLPQGFEDHVGAQEQDALDVSDACAVDPQRDSQVSYCPDAPQVGVVADELAAAVFAQETLFSLSGFAIFNDAC